MTDKPLLVEIEEVIEMILDHVGSCCDCWEIGASEEEKNKLQQTLTALRTAKAGKVEGLAEALEDAQTRMPELCGSRAIREAAARYLEIVGA